MRNHYSRRGRAYRDQIDGPEAGILILPEPPPPSDPGDGTPLWGVTINHYGQAEQLEFHSAIAAEHIASRAQADGALVKVERLG